MPNLFPEGKNEPLYNTVDAALLFINCVWLYYEKTQDIKFVEKMYPVMQRIISGYERGTNFNIHMEEDGLISAGSGVGSGDMDGCTCGRNPSDTKTWETGGDQCLLV